MSKKYFTNSETALTKLKNSLNGGDRRSVFLNATPSNLNKLDLKKLDLIKPKNASKFVDWLLGGTNKPFELNLEIVNENLNNEEIQLFGLNHDNSKINKEIDKEIDNLEKKFESLFNTDKDLFQETGISGMGFGFPIIVFKHENKNFTAPLIIFNIILERNDKKLITWNIKLDPNNSYSINPMLVNKIKEIAIIDIADSIIDSNDNGFIDKEELLSYIRVLKEKIKLQKDCDFESIVSIPNQTNDNLYQEGVFNLYNSGIFSSKFYSQYSTIINDYDEPDIFISTDNSNFTYQDTHIAIDKYDASQSKIVKMLDKNEVLVIQGPPGTGKSSTINSIIENGLLHGLKILVVCKKNAALEVLLQKLNKHELSNLAVLINDPTKDRTSIVKKARELIDSQNNAYYAILEPNQTDISKINTQLQVSNEILRNFQSTNLKHNVNKFLKFKKIFKYDELELMRIKKITKTETELEEIFGIIDEMQAKFNQYRKLDQSITKIKIDLELQPASTFIQMIKDLIIESRVEIQDTLANIEKYTKDKKQFIENEIIQEIAKYSELLSKLKDLYQELDHSYLEKYFILSIQTKIQVKFPFLFNTQKTRYGKFLVLKDQFEILKKEVLKIKAITTLEENISLSLLKRYIVKLEAEIQVQNEILDTVRILSDLEVNQSFKSNKLLSSVSFIKNANYIFEKINILIEVKPFQNLTDYTQAQIVKEKLQEIDNYLSEIFTNSAKIQIAYDYEYMVKSLSVDNKQIFDICRRGLIDQKWTDYVGFAFYSNLLLEMDKTNSYPQNLNFFEEIETSFTQHTESKIMQKSIKSLWQNKSTKSIVKFEGAKQLYNLRGNGRGARRNSLRKILDRNFELFTDIFPVILTNPSCASAILPPNPEIFDIVIFDEASQIPLEEAYPYIFRGKKVVVSGDSKQMPPSNFFRKNTNNDIENEDELIQEELNTLNEDSLLDFVNNANFVNSTLDFHYRSKNPNLIAFSNAAFYDSKLIPMPPKQEDSIIFYNVGGSYENYANTIEAEKVIEILQDLMKKYTDLKVPSVGVATFNMQQQNWIRQKIIEKRQKDKMFEIWMDKLESQDDKFFVKNLENIQGDERDVIIISTTFGKDRVGNFRQNFGPVAQDKGDKLLNVLITRSKHNLYIVTSIPDSYILGYNETEGKKRYLYGFLQFSKLTSLGEFGQAQTVLNHFSTKDPRFENQYSGETESPFEDEVKEFLKSKGVFAISNKKYGGYRIDLIVESNNKCLAIECDGASYHDSDEAITYDNHRQKILENEYGLTFYRIYSRNWWVDQPEAEKQLLNAINSFFTQSNN